MPLRTQLQNLFLTRYILKILANLFSIIIYGGENNYTLGLAKQNEACIIDSIEYKGNCLVGGKCVGFTEVNNEHIYSWKEYQLEGKNLLGLENAEK